MTNGGIIMKRFVVSILLLTFIFTIFGCSSIETIRTKKENNEELTDGEFEVYKDFLRTAEPDKLTKDEQFIKAFLELPSITEQPKSTYQPKTTAMKIIKHTWDFERDYVYVTGSVENTGETNIRYFEVVVEYLDRNDRVIDSDYTNCGEIIKPGNQKTFEIISKIPGEGIANYVDNPDGLDGYRLYLHDVTAE
jgi:hypothetical protein